jgi:hypothetical protein
MVAFLFCTKGRFKMAWTQQAQSSGRQFYQGQPGTTVSTLYTAPAASSNVTSPSATAYIKEIILANTTGAAATVTLYLVPSGGTAGVANMIVPALSINANDAKVLAGLNTFIPAGATIQGVQGTSGAITVTISGMEVQ